MADKQNSWTIPDDFEQKELTTHDLQKIQDFLLQELLISPTMANKQKLQMFRDMMVEKQKTMMMEEDAQKEPTTHDFLKIRDFLIQELLMADKKKLSIHDLMADKQKLQMFRDMMQKTMMREEDTQKRWTPDDRAVQLMIHEMEMLQNSEVQKESTTHDLEEDTQKEPTTLDLEPQYVEFLPGMKVHKPTLTNVLKKIHERAAQLNEQVLNERRQMAMAAQMMNKVSNVDCYSPSPSSNAQRPHPRPFTMRDVYTTFEEVIKKENPFAVIDPSWRTDPFLDLVDRPRPPRDPSLPQISYEYDGRDFI